MNVISFSLKQLLNGSHRVQCVVALGLFFMLSVVSATAQEQSLEKQIEPQPVAMQAVSPSVAQQTASLSAAKQADLQPQPVPTPKLEFFAGAELLYRDIFLNKLFETVVNITPGVKWNMGHSWQLAGQVIIPVHNDYGERYKKVRLNMAVLSKEWAFPGKQFVKVSGGLFSMERYGLDVKWMWPVNNWLAFDANLGVTGFCSMAVDWECSKVERVTGWAGARFYLDRLHTEFRLRGGRYLYNDYGAQVEVMRHFRHCTISAFAQYNDLDHENAGFKIVMMIPPYKRKARKVQFRPATNFRLTHNFKSQAYAMKTYMTDPEENEREGYFNRTKLNWGANTMAPDFQLKKGGKK